MKQILKNKAFFLDFENKDDYDLIEQEDKITIENLEEIAPDVQ